MPKLDSVGHQCQQSVNSQSSTRSRHFVKYIRVKTLRPKTIVDTVNAIAPMIYIFVICVPAANRSSPSGGSDINGAGYNESAIFVDIQHRQDDSKMEKTSSKFFLVTRLVAFLILNISRLTRLFWSSI